jgi:hypothetical protein
MSTGYCSCPTAIKEPNLASVGPWLNTSYVLNSRKEKKIDCNFSLLYVSRKTEEQTVNPAICAAGENVGQNGSIELGRFL